MLRKNNYDFVKKSIIDLKILINYYINAKHTISKITLEKYYFCRFRSKLKVNKIVSY